jgi:hypothetical protein
MQVMQQQKTITKFDVGGSQTLLERQLIEN